MVFGLLCVYPEFMNAKRSKDISCFDLVQRACMFFFFCISSLILNSAIIPLEWHIFMYVKTLCIVTIVAGVVCSRWLGMETISNDYYSSTTNE